MDQLDLSHDILSGLLHLAEWNTHYDLQPISRAKTRGPDLTLLVHPSIGRAWSIYKIEGPHLLAPRAMNMGK